MGGWKWGGMAAAMLAMAGTGAQAAESCACALVQSAAADALFSIPFRTVDGRIYIEARVDGQGPFVFAVDTGASGMARADARLVARLASLDLAGLVRRDLEVITRDYASRLSAEAGFDGIVGRDFFGDGLLIIDYPSRMLRFTRKAGLARGAPGVLAYERAFRVPATIGGIAAEANLDTGANVAFVLPKALFDRVGGGPVAAASEGRLTNSTVDTRRAMVAGPFRIGGAELSNVEVRVSENYPELLAGAHALQHFALLIDQRTKAVALCPPEAD